MRRWRSGSMSHSDRDDPLAQVYLVLNSRYGSNTTLQWQVPLYVFPVQAALIVGIASSSGGLAVALGAIAAFIGAIAALVMWRIELTARLDRQTLGEFEERLLPDDPQMTLLHNAQFFE